MKTLALNFGSAFPNFAPTEFSGSCTIYEPQNKGTNKFQKLTITGTDGYLFPHDLASKSSSFAISSGSKQCLCRDCDGILLIEHNDKKYLIVCELKSLFSSDEIVKAKDQLVGSYIKMIGILSTLQNFKKEDYEVKGIIASFEPSSEIIDALTKSEDDPKKRFAYRLQYEKKYHMPENKCKNFFKPLDVRDFDIFYVPVPDRAIEYKVDIISLLRI